MAKRTPKTLSRSRPFQKGDLVYIYDENNKNFKFKRCHEGGVGIVQSASGDLVQVRLQFPLVNTEFVGKHFPSYFEKDSTGIRLKRYKNHFDIYVKPETLFHATTVQDSGLKETLIKVQPGKDTLDGGYVEMTLRPWDNCHILVFQLNGKKSLNIESSGDRRPIMSLYNVISSSNGELTIDDIRTMCESTQKKCPEDVVFSEENY